MKKFEVHLQNGEQLVLEGELMTTCESTGQVFIYSSELPSFNSLKCIVPPSGFVFCFDTQPINEKDSHEQH